MSCDLNIRCDGEHSDRRKSVINEGDSVYCEECVYTLKEKIKELESQLEDLQTENGGLENDNEQLKIENEEFKKEISVLENMNNA